MAGFMREAIAFALSNFTLTFLVLGLVAAAISLLRRPPPTPPRVIVEELFAYFLLFSIGIAYSYYFVFHVFSGGTAAEFTGREQSPLFRAEVGFASLSFSAVGFMAFRSGSGVRAAAVVGPAPVSSRSPPGSTSARCWWPTTSRRATRGASSTRTSASPSSGSPSCGSSTGPGAPSPPASAAMEREPAGT